MTNYLTDDAVREFCERYYVDRRGTNCEKWDGLGKDFGDADLIAMWVADMEFKAPECVRDALISRVEHGVFGYTFVPDSYYDAVIDWERAHHGYELKKEWIRITPGVVAGFYWAVNIYTEPGDAVIVQTPVYYPFQNAVRDNGRKLITVDLDYNDGRFTCNAAAFEQAIIDNDVKMYILCSPHNPVGRVWTEDELKEQIEICKRHDVMIISDEIHQDLVFGDSKHIPAALVAAGMSGDSTEGKSSTDLAGERYDKLITLFASSKTFNLASCLTSTVVIENDDLRAKWDEFMKVYHNVGTNVFGITAVEAALRGGEEWYEGLKKVIWHNYELVRDGLAEFPGVRVASLEGTYLVFVDLSAYVPADEMKAFVQDKCRLAVDYGDWFGANWGTFIRLNLGTHPALVEEAVANLRKNLAELVK